MGSLEKNQDLKPRPEPIPYEKKEEESNDINDNVKERIRAAHRKSRSA
jgi:hypothetical protein